MIRATKRLRRKKSKIELKLFQQNKALRRIIIRLKDDLFYFRNKQIEANEECGKLTTEASQLRYLILQIFTNGYDHTKPMPKYIMAVFKESSFYQQVIADQAGRFVADLLNKEKKPKLSDLAKIYSDEENAKTLHDIEITGVS